MRDAKKQLFGLLVENNVGKVVSLIHLGIANIFRGDSNDKVARIFVALEKASLEGENAESFVFLGDYAIVTNRNLVLAKEIEILSITSKVHATTRARVSSQPEKKCFAFQLMTIEIKNPVVGTSVDAGSTRKSTRENTSFQVHEISIQRGLQDSSGEDVFVLAVLEVLGTLQGSRKADYSDVDTTTSGNATRNYEGVCLARVDHYGLFGFPTTA